ncbi:MAG: hypothetical protein ACREFQ_03080 [Stellaceae bacterium]
MDESRYPARNWSLGGFLLEGAPAVNVGAKLSGHLVVEGRPERPEMTALAVRRDHRAGTLACRFIEPSPTVVDALDWAITGRLLRRSVRRPGVASAVLGALFFLIGPAQASAGGVLVPGSAPLPQFHLNFPNLMIDPMGPPAPPGDLSISLTSPDKGVIQFLFSPRSQFGFARDPETGTSRSYAGLSWNLFEDGRFFGKLGLAGSLTRPGAEDIFHSWRYFGPAFALHSTFEIGYQLGDGHSLTLSLDHASEPSFFTDRYELDNLRLRYGLKF